jgi:transcriptional repressor NrdR
MQDSATRPSRILHVLCPVCSSETQVIDTRPAPDAVRRRRECVGCAQRFTTYERMEEQRATVIKRDGTKERFDRLKLQRGLARAAGGRPVSQEQLEAVTAWIAAEVHKQGEIHAERVGELAERGLARVDPVSAIQFASVYRNLRDLDELEAVVRRFKDDPLPSEDQLAIEGSIPSGPESNIGRSRKVRPNLRRGHVPQP